MGVINIYLYKEVYNDFSVGVPHGIFWLGTDVLLAPLVKFWIQPDSFVFYFQDKSLTFPTIVHFAFIQPKMPSTSLYRFLDPISMCRGRKSYPMPTSNPLDTRWVSCSSTQLGCCPSRDSIRPCRLKAQSYKTVPINFRCQSQAQLSPVLLNNQL